MMEYYILTGVVCFILGFLSFGALLSGSNKEMHKQTLRDNELLKSDNKKLSVKIDNLLDVIIQIKNK